MRATTALQPVPFRLQPLAFVDLQARRTAEVLSIIRAAILGDYSPSTSFSVADSRHKSDRPKAILAIDICQCARPGPSPSLDTCLSPLASYAFPRRPHDGRLHNATRRAITLARPAAMPASFATVSAVSRATRCEPAISTIPVSFRCSEWRPIWFFMWVRLACRQDAQSKAFNADLTHLSHCPAPMRTDGGTLRAIVPPSIPAGVSRLDFC